MTSPTKSKAKRQTFGDANSRPRKQQQTKETNQPTAIRGDTAIPVDHSKRRVTSNTVSNMSETQPFAINDDTNSHLNAYATQAFNDSTIKESFSGNFVLNSEGSIDGSNFSKGLLGGDSTGRNADLVKKTSLQESYYPMVNNEQDYYHMGIVDAYGNDSAGHYDHNLWHSEIPRNAESEPNIYESRSISPPSPQNRYNISNQVTNDGTFSSDSIYKPSKRSLSLNLIKTNDTNADKHALIKGNSKDKDKAKVVKPRIATTYWDDEKTLCYQVEANGILVSRREDTNFVNGTKLLNLAGMSRGKRDGILKTEKIKKVVKIGSMNLKGVWVPFERACEIARNEGLDQLLFPLFVRDLKGYFKKDGWLLKNNERVSDYVESDE